MVNSIKITRSFVDIAPKRKFYQSKKLASSPVTVSWSGGRKCRIAIKGLDKPEYHIHAKILTSTSKTRPKLNFFSSLFFVVLKAKNSKGKAIWIKANRGSLERLGLNTDKLKHVDKFPTREGSQAYVSRNIKDLIKKNKVII